MQLEVSTADPPNCAQPDGLMNKYAVVMLRPQVVVWSGFLCSNRQLMETSMSNMRLAKDIMGHPY